MPFVIPLLWVFAALFGATVGSFLNVCIWRVPRDGMSVSSPRRSHCPACGTALSWFDNIPLVSWLVLGGRCRSCRAPISVRYFVVEALTATIFGVLAYKYLRTGAVEWELFLVLSVLAAALLVASFVDMDLRILPNEITLTGMMLMPVVGLSVPGLHTREVDRWLWLALASLESPLRTLSASLPDFLGRAWGTAPFVLVASALAAVIGLYGYRAYWRWAHPDEPKRLRDGALCAVLLGSAGGVVATILVHPDMILHPRVFSFAATIVGMATGAGLVFGVGVLGSAVFRKPAMGFGDVKLMGLLGGFAGWAGVLLGFGLACLLGSVVGIYRRIRYRTRYLWFGPFLSLGCFFVIVFPGAVHRALRWYASLLGGG